MKKALLLLSLTALFAACTQSQPVAEIPLPEHPRPDFQRNDFVNLNGQWKFTFNGTLGEGPVKKFDREILVPFPWGSELSGAKDDGDIAWYGREIIVPSDWKDKRVFVVVGAADWETTAWLDGISLGSHQGGYTPFEFEITQNMECGKAQQLVLKVDDTYSSAHLYGKQGYGNARGIWHTVYLEARGSNYIKSLHFSPDIDNSKVVASVTLESPAAAGTEVCLSFINSEREPAKATFDEGSQSLSVDINLDNQHLWNLDDPYLYEVKASLTCSGEACDEVSSYFGQRKISTVTVPGQDYKYVALNNSPIYLQLCLDQSYNPKGFYTFPSDEFMKNEILISKKLGLNGNRVHIKAEVPRKLYWADKLGLLIMADVPNFWGEPVPEAKADWEKCMREQVQRDYNHPSIFAWVDFNETWGLFTKVHGKNTYTKETQEWVREMYLQTKALDPTRLVEDNSACNQDHVQTDIDSWHGYHTNYQWEEVANKFDSQTFTGTSFNYAKDNVKGDEPMINSECGNVWGYEGSAGDCDYTWDYHEMMNAFHRHLKIGGWLYTEHHDVINEWNGYVRYDRSEKTDGLCDFVPGMSVKDFHTPYYIVPMSHFSISAKAGSKFSIPVCSSIVTDRNPGKMTLNVAYVGYDGTDYGKAAYDVPFEPFKLSSVATLTAVAPQRNDLVTVQMVLRNEAGDTLARNFCLVKVVSGKPSEPNSVSFSPASFCASSWSLKQSSVYDGLKVNGFGYGSFEYKVQLPEGAKKAVLVFEASAKQLFGKDVDDGVKVGDDFMLGHGTFDPCKISNSYAMTDTVLWPSKLVVSVNGRQLETVELPDDPADHRGALSWMAQPHNRRMSEAGSYGYLVKVKIPDDVLKSGEQQTITLSVPQDAASDKGGGLAIYGKDFGRYPFDPTIYFE